MDPNNPQDPTQQPVGDPVTAPAQSPVDQPVQDQPTAPVTPEPMIETPETPAEMPGGAPAPTVPDETQGETGGTPPVTPAA